MCSSGGVKRNGWSSVSREAAAAEDHHASALHATPGKGKVCMETEEERVCRKGTAQPQEEKEGCGYRQ